MKALLKVERDDVREYLELHQLAAGTAAGIEVYVHVTRQWYESNRTSLTKVLLEKDKKNAFNIVDRHKMLVACQERLPGASRFAEWCYGQPANLYLYWYCQQGCPLAMALYSNSVNTLA